MDESFNLVLPGKGNPQGGKGVGSDEPQYAANMVAEPHRSDEDMVKLVSMVVQGLLPQLKGAVPKGKGDEREFKSKAVLDEKYFRRMEKFSGDMG
eukprot:12086213-Karenia_brevis.AAC.1